MKRLQHYARKRLCKCYHLPPKKFGWKSWQRGTQTKTLNVCNVTPGGVIRQRRRGQRDIPREPRHQAKIAFSQTYCTPPPPCRFVNRLDKTNCKTFIFGGKKSPRDRGKGGTIGARNMKKGKKKCTIHKGKAHFSVCYLFCFVLNCFTVTYVNLPLRDKPWKNVYILGWNRFWLVCERRRTRKLHPYEQR